MVGTYVYQFEEEVLQVSAVFIAPTPQRFPERAKHRSSIDMSMYYGALMILSTRLENLELFNRYNELYELSAMWLEMI